MKQLLHNKLADTPLFHWMVFGVITYAWISYLLALTGVFYTSLLWILWIAVLIASYKLQFIPRFRITGTLSIGLMTLLVIIIFLTTTSAPSVFEGRDQGSIAAAATMLAQDHTTLHKFPLQDIFYRVYGEGKALNFPGFVYRADGTLSTQFPLPYIAFLGGFIGTYGTQGIVLGNAILLFAGIISFVGLLQLTIGRRGFRTAALLLLLASFGTLYFAKLSLSENLAFFIVIASTFYLLRLRTNLTRTALLLFAL